MSVADWRALLEALLDGRLSAQAFARRFMEAVRDSKKRGLAVPLPIREILSAVEEFEAASVDQEEFAVNADELEEAVRRALSNLDDAPPQPRTFDRARARDDMRRFSVQVSGCMGLGCVIGAIWVGLCVLQIYFVSEEIQYAFGWSAWPSAFFGFFLAFVPIVGNVLAFLGATRAGWEPVLAAIVFFAAPAATLFSGWSRWRRLG